MPRYALLNDGETGVENTIVLERPGITQYGGKTVVELGRKVRVGPGFTYDGRNFTPPTAKPDVNAARKQAIQDANSIAALRDAVLAALYPDDT
jgi:hypothetical protein